MDLDPEEEALSGLRDEEANVPESSATLCLHAFSDLTHVSPLVFLYLLKECYIHGKVSSFTAFVLKVSSFTFFFLKVSSFTTSFPQSPKLYCFFPQSLKLYGNLVSSLITFSVFQEATRQRRSFKLYSIKFIKFLLINHNQVLQLSLFSALLCSLCLEQHTVKDLVTC